MMEAQWDFLELGMTHLADGYPEHFTLMRDGNPGAGKIACWI